MIANSEKLPNENIPENACPDCDGVGKRLMRPVEGWRDPFTVICDNCHGEKTMSPELIARNELGKMLRHELQVHRVSPLDAAKRFGGRVSEWSDARSGRATIEDIEGKLGLLRKAYEVEA